jgi:hypothetical protein
MTKLFIAGVEVPVMQDLGIKITYSVADMRTPEFRDFDFSKTISLPSVKSVDTLFEFIFDVNLDLQTFNPNKKTDAEVYLNEHRIFKGSIQIVRIEMNLQTGQYIYSCNLIGEGGDLFKQIGDKLLTNNDDSADDIDLNSNPYSYNFNHALDRSTIQRSWGDWNGTGYNGSNTPKNWNGTAFVNTVAGYGYRYPLIYYGQYQFNNLSQMFGHTWETRYMRPAIPIYQIIKQIFTKAGKTFTSTFLESTNFKKLVIPFSNEKLEPDQTEYDNRTFVVGYHNLYTQSLTTPTLTFVSSSFATYIYTTGLNTIALTNPRETATTSPIYNYYDNGNQHNASTGLVTVGQSGNYILSLNAGTPTFTNNIINTIILATCVGGAYIQRSTDGGSTWTTIAQTNFNNTLTNGSISTWDVNVDVEVSLNGGDLINTLVDYTLNITTVGIISGGFTSATISNGSFSMQNQSEEIDEGMTVVINKCLPTGVKQLDLLKDIIKMFNLVFMIDKDDQNNYIIEPFVDSSNPTESFYPMLGTASGSGTNFEVFDWTDKLDIGKKFEVLPMQELDFKTYTLKYKDDSDYLNTKAKEIVGETFGTKEIEVDNDFVNQAKTNELGFSATPNAYPNLYTATVPYIYSFDNGTVSKFKPNIRLLYYNDWVNGTNFNTGYGTIFKDWTLYGFTTSLYTAVFTGNGTSQPTYGYYPYAGHTDNPLTPTYDLNFQTKYLDYPFLGTFTTNNLYNLYHKAFIDMVSDQNSKVVKAYFNLNAIDIKSFTFRSKVFINNTYYLVNKIVDFDPLSSETTLVELIRMPLYNGFTPEVYNPDNGPALRQLSGNTNLGGSGNNNYGADSAVIGGTDNYISDGARNVNLINCSGVIVNSDVENFTGVGLTNEVIETQHSGVSMLRGSVGGYTTLVGSNYTTEDIYSCYLVDTSDSNVYLTLNDRTDEVTVKKLGAPHKVIITPDEGTIDGDPTYEINTANHSVKLIKWNGNWYITAIYT